MQAWLDDYEHVPITSCAGNYISVPWRMVLHTTEGRNGSMAGLIPFFQQRPCSTPHFAIDPLDGRKVQFIPVDRAAAALRGGQGGYETNRARCIQTEIIGFAGEAHTWPDSWVDFVGQHVADVVAAGVPLNLDREIRFLGQGDGVLATPSAAQRMTPDQWHAFDGVCGHQHVPFNDHWDPGRIDIGRLLAAARGQQEDDMPLTDDDAVKVAQATARHLALDDAFLTAVAVKVGRLVGGQSKAEGQTWAQGITNLGDAINATLKTAVGGGVDPDAVAAAVVDDLADRLANG